MTKAPAFSFPHGFGLTAPHAMSLAALSIESGFMLGCVGAFLHKREGATLQEALAAHARLFVLTMELAKRAESAV